MTELQVSSSDILEMTKKIKVLEANLKESEERVAKLDPVKDREAKKAITKICQLARAKLDETKAHLAICTDAYDKLQYLLSCH